MEASQWFLSFLVLLLVVSRPVLSENKPVYFKDGGELVLRPAVVPEHISSVEWQFESPPSVYQVAQWVKDKLPLNYYTRFKDRATLNLTTGELRLSGMKSSDQGTFMVEINNMQQSVKFAAKLMKELDRPEILLRTLSCNAESRECTLTCSAHTHQAEPVTYSWSLDDGPWKEGPKDQVIVNKLTTDATANAKSYRCRVMNYVSQQDSEPHPDPFSRTAPEPGDTGDTGAVVGGVFGGIILLALVVIGLLYGFKRELFNRYFSFLPCVEENPEPQPTNGGAANPEELKTLNGDTV